MTLRQTAYYMALVGGLAGLVCWLLQTLLSDFVRFDSAAAQVTTYAMLMGALISGMGVFFGDLWSGDRPKLIWIGSGLALGLIAGLFTGGIYRFLLAGDPAGAGHLTRVLVWCVAGGSIGFVTGLRWLEVNRWRPLHGLIGGAVGGSVGGIIFLVAGTSEFFQALAFILTGVGITLGVTLASVLLRDAVLRFVKSESEEAAELYGDSTQEWVLQRGDRTWIGNMGAEMTTTFYSRGVQVFLPDEQLQPRHAVIYDRSGEFVVEPFRGALDFEEPAPTRVNGRTIESATPLADGAVVTIGSTSLEFALQQSLLGASSPVAPVEQAGEEAPATEPPAADQLEPTPVEMPAPTTADPAGSTPGAVKQDGVVSSLADLIQATPQDPTFVLPHFIATCRTLAQDLDSGRSHPTLSPAAVKLEGLSGARIASQDAARPQDSTRRIIPRYAAPELFRSQEGQPPTPAERTEIYVLGHIFYETLLGEEGHRREFAEVYSADDPTYPWYQWHSGPEEATPLAQQVQGMPEALSDLVSRMMRKDEARRVATVAEVMDALKSIEDELTEADRSTIIRRPAKAGPMASRGWLPWAIVGGVLLILIVIWSVVLAQYRREPGDRQPADATLQRSEPIRSQSPPDPG